MKETLEEKPRRNKLVLGLAVAAGAALLVGIGILIGNYGKQPEPAAPPDPPTKPGETAVSTKLPNPPPPTDAVPPERAQKGLQVGKSYLTRSRGAMTMRGTDQDWGLVTAITIAYTFDAEVDRKIEHNDGKTVVELRTYRKVHSTKLDTKLEDIRLDLGPAGNFVLAGVGLLKPEALPFVAGAKQLLEGNAITTALSMTGLDQNVAASIAQRDPSAKLFTKVGDLEGKQVRITYQNRQDGECSVTPVGCTLTGEETRFIAASVLLADALIFPDMEVKQGDRWRVKGSNLIGMMDPSLLAYTDGAVFVERGPEELVPSRKERCIRLKVGDGKLTFQHADRKRESMGYFSPEGWLLFSPQDQIIIDGELKGKASITIQTVQGQGHLLFPCRSERVPEMTVRYECTIQEGMPK